MYAWFYNCEDDVYEYVFEAYEVFVSQESGSWAYDAYVAGRWFAHKCGFALIETAMNAGSTAVWDDYHDSVTIQDFCGV